jgi:hypothetical protein
MNLLGWEQWTLELSILGGRSSGSDEFEILPGLAYTYDLATGAYSETASPAPTSFSGNSCTNALKEVSYNVELAAMAADGDSNEAYYKIQAISADIVLYPSVSGDTANIGFIDQTYYINFLTESDVTNL